MSVFNGLRPLAVVTGLALALVVSIPTMLVLGMFFAAVFRQQGDASPTVAQQVYESHPANLVALFVGGLTDLIAGFVAARLGRAAPYKNAIAAGCGIIASSLLVLPQIRAATPLPYVVGSFLVVIPAVVLGARLAGAHR